MQVPAMVWIVLRSALLAWMLWCTLLFLLQRQLIFPGAWMDLPQIAPPMDAKLVWLDAGEQQVEAWWLPPLGEPQHGVQAALLAHGNGELIDYWPSMVESLRTRGIGVLLVEFPGYGRSPGKPSERAIQASMRSGWDWLVTQPGVEADGIVGIGRSIGSGAVCGLSRERALAGLMLDAPMTRLADFARRHLAPAFLLRDRFDNLQAISAFQGELLIFHGRRDEVIPYAHGERLAQAHPHSDLVTRNCGHNDCEPGWVEYPEALDRWLRAIAGRRAAPAEAPAAPQAD